MLCVYCWMREAVIRYWPLQLIHGEWRHDLHDDICRECAAPLELHGDEAIMLVNGA